jgi:thiol:disulfide interchange protein
MKAFCVFSQAKIPAMKTHILLFIVPLLFIVHCSLFTASAQEPARPYNENQDIRADLKKAVDQAKKENKHVLLQFGGNWCPWCIRFHQMAHNAKTIDSLLKADYVYMLANVSQDKKKRDYKLFEEYGYPNRFGYPVFVVLDRNGKELHIQDSGILEHCREKGYDTAKVVNFLKMWTIRAIDPATYEPLRK